MKKFFIIPLAGLLLLVLSSCLTTENPRSVMISGTGSVKAVPDKVAFDVTFTETAETTALARDRVNKKIDLALIPMKKAGIKDTSIQTSRLTYRRKTRWVEGEEIQMGQEASQTLHVSMNMDDQGASLNNLIDEITAIDGLGLGSLSFSLKDRSSYEQEARRLAYEDALTKAEDYARFSGLALGPLLSLSENQSLPQPVYYPAAEFKAVSMNSGSTSVMGGENEIIITVHTAFELR
jgi:uncharacterized protein YggE